MRNIRLFSFSSLGHRAIFDDVLTLAMAKHGFKICSEARAADADFFTMLDDRIAVFVWKALINSLRGRRLVGLFFRPGECFRRTHLRYMIKYAIFRCLKILPNVRVLTIMPFALTPRFREIAHGWIYDPQLWDLDVLSVGASAARQTIATEVLRVAHGRRVVVALGYQARQKGFDFFTRLYSESDKIKDQFLFVAAGTLEECCRSSAADFAKNGGLVIDRYISDDEMYGLYDAADLVWACYAPSYNQASGIFGRAIQFGRHSIVRQSSYMHDLALRLKFPIIALDPDGPLHTSAQALINAVATPSNLSPSKPNIAAMRKQAETALISAFGL